MEVLTYVSSLDTADVRESPPPKKLFLNLYILTLTRTKQVYIVNELKQYLNIYIYNKYNKYIYIYMNQWMN